MKKEKPDIYIGTSNVVIPGNKSTFPTAFQTNSRLHYYGSLFNTVEINQSFYKAPQFATYAKWVDEVPENFRFSIKLTRELTHVKELKSDLSDVGKFMQTASGTGKKKGCLLIQFPGKISIEYFEQVENLLQELDDCDPERSWRRAVEFRNVSWYIGETRELLDQFGASMVLQDIPRSRYWQFNVKASFVYLRFHGPKGDYRDSYSNSFLQEKAAEIKAWHAEGKDVYAYFNNTIGNAFENASRLKKNLSV